MKKKHKKPVEGRDYERLHNGVFIVSRKFDNPTQGYEEQKIPDYLSLVDHSLKLSKDEYNARLAAAEQEFNELVRERLEPAKRSLIIVLQGRDGAGKTGARVRIENALDNDAKLFLAICIGAPTEDERAHPYLWRFFTGERMPKFGQVRVFDRSWAERLLVEPVMGFASKEAVRRSFGEIRSFEWLLRQQGAVLVKFWMDISYDEQERRFKARREGKPWKISDLDETAREHWDDYTVCANEMFHRTGTDFAPWHIVSSEDKRYSRVIVLETINRVLREQCPKP